MTTPLIKRYLLLMFFCVFFIMASLDTGAYTQTGYKVQQGRALVTQKSQTITIDAVSNLSNAFILPPFYYSTGQRAVEEETGTGAQTDHDWADYTVFLGNRSVINLTREAADDGIYVSWQLLEALDREFAVYRGYYDASSSGSDFYIPIGNNVTAADTMVLVTGYHSNDTGRDFYDRYLMRAYAYNESHIRVRRGDGTNSDLHISWVAVEWNSEKIDSFQTGTVLLDGPANNQSNPATAALATPVNLSCSMLFFQIDAPNSGLDQVAVAGNISSENQVAFYASGVGGTADTAVDRNVRWYLVDFGNGCVNMARGMVDYSSNADWANYTKLLSSPLQLNRTLVRASLTHDGAGDAQPRPFPNVWMQDSERFTVHRTRTGQEAFIEWNLVELPYTMHNIKWNQSLLPLGIELRKDGNLSGSARLDFVGNHTNISTECVSGNCSIISDDWLDGRNISSGESFLDNFTCLNTTLGVFWAGFSISSDQDENTGVLNVTCEFYDSINIAWDQTSLDLGTGNHTLGNLSSSVYMNSSDTHSSINVTCSGDCRNIVSNWTNETGMADGESKMVHFECADQVLGYFDASFEVISVEDDIPSTIFINCSMKDVLPPPKVNGLDNTTSGYSWILWNWTNPDDPSFEHVEVWVNGTFFYNVSANYTNVTGLWPATLYEIQLRTVDNVTNINTTWENDLGGTLFNNASRIYLSAPQDNSTAPDDWRQIELSAEDDESDHLCVDIYGKAGSAPDHESLLYRNCSVLNNSLIGFNWSGLVLGHDAGIEVLWHFDNRSEYGESDSLVYDFAQETTVHNISCTVNCPGFIENSGWLAGAFDFNGIDESFSMTDQFFNDAFTTKFIQVWINADDTSGTRTIFEEGGATNGFGLRLNDGLLEFATQDNQNIFLISYPYSYIGSWHFITAQFNDTNMTLYLDGVLVNTTNSSYGSVSAHSDEAGVGYTNGGDAFDGGSGSYFDGRIDELRIGTSSLTDEEVMYGYNFSINTTYYWFANSSDQFFTTGSDVFRFTVSFGNISWNVSELDMGFRDPILGNMTKNATVRAAGRQSGINISCSLGDCSVITDDWVNSTSLPDQGQMQVNFTCSNDTAGVFSVLYDVLSDYDMSPDKINVSCEILPDINVVWNQTVLDLGSIDEQEGNLTGYLNITSNEINNEVNVSCISGDCAKIVQNWTNRTAMVDSQTESVRFECNDSEPGLFEAEFQVVSVEDSVPNIVDVYCEMRNPPPGSVSGLLNSSDGYSWIVWNWTNPADYDFDHVEVWINKTFFANTSGNYTNVTGLYHNTEYEIQTITVDISLNKNTTWINDSASTDYNFAPSQILSPENWSVYRRSPVSIYSWVEDNDSQGLCLDMYGENDSGPEGLLFSLCGIANNTNTSDSWIAPVLRPDADTEVLWHFDNQTEYGENDGFVYNFAPSVQDHDLVCRSNCPDFRENGGIFSGCFEYDGAGQLWQMNESYFNDLFYVKTFQAWINPSDLSGTEDIYEEGGGTNGFAIRIADERIEFSVRNGSVQTTISAVLPDAGWHLITAVFDNAEMLLYVDGAEENSTTASYSYIDNHGDDAALGGTQGSNAFGGSASTFQGRIDEVRILDYSRSPAQIEGDAALSEGKYFWYADVSDEFRAVSSGLYVFSIDKTPPHVILDSSLNNSYTTQIQPAVDYYFNDTYSPFSNCTLFFDSIPYNTTYNISNSTWISVVANTSLADSNYSVQVNCTDSVGNNGSSQVSYIVLDTLNPNVSDVLPSYDSVYYLFEEVNITANVTDTSVDVVRANITWSGGSALHQMFNSGSGTVYDTMFMNTNSIGRYNVTIIANDSAGNINSTGSTWFNVTSSSAIDVILDSPNNRSGDSDGEMIFFFNVTSNYLLSNCSLLVNRSVYGSIVNVINDTENNISLSGLDIGKYIWQINCTDDYGGYNISSERLFTVLRATEYGGQTTDFSQVDMENITDLVIEVEDSGFINFSEDINLSEGIDMDSYLNIAGNLISVDTYNYPNMNRSAQLMFYGLDYSFEPVPLKDGEACADCINISYDSGTGIYIMNVTHFTAYTTTANSQLIGYDDADQGVPTGLDTQLGFYANYSKTDAGSFGDPIVGAGVWCRVTFDDSPLLTYDMQYQDGLYVHNRSFIAEDSYIFNITCDGSSEGFESASVEDTIDVVRAKGYDREGNCTIEYLQQGDNHVEGYLQDGDEIRIYCESPMVVEGGEEITITVIPENGFEERKYIWAPDVMENEHEILYP